MDDHFFKVLLQNKVHIHQQSFLPSDPNLFPASNLLTRPYLSFIKFSVPCIFTLPTFFFPVSAFRFQVIQCRYLEAFLGLPRSLSSVCFSGIPSP